jgi:hypothetical protein
MKLVDFDKAEPEDIFHSHGYAKIAYGQNLGSASSVPGGGRAGAKDIGAVGTYHYASVSQRQADDPAQNKETPPTDTDSSRHKLQVKERPDKGEGAAFSHRDPSESPMHTFREPPGRSYNPYG